MCKTWPLRLTHHWFKISSQAVEQAGLTSLPLCMSALCSELNPEEFCVILLKIVRETRTWPRPACCHGQAERAENSRGWLMWKVVDDTCVIQYPQRKKRSKNSMMLPTTQSFNNCIRATCTQYFMLIDMVKQTLQVSRNDNEKSQGEVTVIAQTCRYGTCQRS